MFCVQCWHLSTVTVKGHSSRLVTLGSAGVFKMLVFCIRTLAVFKCWHLSTMTVKGHSGRLKTSGSAGVLYTVLAPVDRDCQGT